MTILAIETSSTWCSVALAVNQRAVLQRHEQVGSTASLYLLPWVNTLLEEAQLTLADVDAIAVDIGPGAFTGVRLGIACAQGLALGANLPVLSVISLDSIATQAVLQMDLQGNNDKELLVILDARMGEVYWARYRLQDSLPVRISAPQLALPDDIALEKINWVVGSGVNLCSAAVQALALSEISANALGVLACARQQLAAGAQHDIRLLEPLYVRDKVAFTSAERAGKTSPLAAQ